MLIKEQIERVLVLRLANPPSNVLTGGLIDALRRELSLAAKDDSVRCLLLSSAYPRYFSSGLDLEELLALPPEQRCRPFEALVSLHRELRALPKPIVAALSGSAVLGGWIVAMGCDVRLLSDDGKIALSEIRLGISPTPGLIRRLQSISSSPSLVKELVLRGRALRAEEALAGGFVDRVVPAAQLNEEALKEAKAMARLPGGAFAAVKRALSDGDEQAEERLWRDSHDELRALLATPEAAEGLAAMREKRRPRWDR